MPISKSASLLNSKYLEFQHTRAIEDYIDKALLKYNDNNQYISIQYDLPVELGSICLAIVDTYVALGWKVTSEFISKNDTLMKVKFTFF